MGRRSLLSGRTPLGIEPPVVVERRPATITEWRSAFDGSDDVATTFFHGPEWSALWSDYTDGHYEPSPQLIRFSDGMEAVIGATLERRRTGVHRMHLSPRGTYGGWVSAHQLTPAHHAAIEEEVLRQPSLVWRRTPQGTASASSAQDPADTTHVIDLRDGVAEARARWRPQARREIGRALRGGATVREGTSLADWLAYAEVYRVTASYWARPTSSYERRLFQLFHDLQSPRVRLWLSEVSGDVVAGIVVVSSAHRAVSWSTAMVRGVAPGLTNLLYWEVVDACAREGFDELDLNPSGGHEGVARFKAALGAVPVPAPMVIRRHWSDRLLGGARRSLSRRPR